MIILLLKKQNKQNYVLQIPLKEHIESEEKISKEQRSLQKHKEKQEKLNEKKKKGKVI